MASRIFGIKVATAVLASALAVGGVVAGARNAPPITSSVADVRPPVSSPNATASAVILQTPLPQGTSAPVGETIPQPTTIPPIPSIDKTPSTPLQGPEPQPAVTPRRNSGNAGNLGTAVPKPRAPILEHSVRGLVVAVNGDRIVLRRPNAQGDARVAVLPHTVIREGGKDIPYADLHPGDRLIVIGVPEPDGALGAQAMVVFPGPRVPPRATRGGRQ